LLGGGRGSTPGHAANGSVERDPVTE
jgi:hypothetical protein